MRISILIRAFLNSFIASIIFHSVCSKSTLHNKPLKWRVFYKGNMPSISHSNFWINFFEFLNHCGFFYWYHYAWFDTFASSSFIKYFNFIWLKIEASCQEWLGEGAAITVARWWTVGVSKLWVRIGVGRGVTGNVNIVSVTKCRSTVVTTVHGIRIIRAIHPRLRQFHWCPARLVNQWE